MKIEKISLHDRKTLLIVAVLIAFAVLSRLAPHPANVAPLAAMALLSGALLPRKLALTVPLGAMIVSDWFIGLHGLILYTWGSFVLIALFSSYRLRSISAGSVVGSSLAASVLFYLVTNFGVWLEGRMYEPTLSGLMQSYYNALPFFRNTIAGDMLYSGILFGAYALAMYVTRSRAALKVQS